jgi:hypothetical protein
MSFTMAGISLRYLTSAELCAHEIFRKRISWVHPTFFPRACVLLNPVVPSTKSLVIAPLLSKLFVEEPTAVVWLALLTVLPRGVPSVVTEVWFPSASSVYDSWDWAAELRLATVSFTATLLPLAVRVPRRKLVRRLPESYAVELSPTALLLAW